MPRLPCISKCKAKTKSSSPAIRYPSGLVCGARPVVRPPPPTPTLALAIPPVVRSPSPDPSSHSELTDPPASVRAVDGAALAYSESRPRARAASRLLPFSSLRSPCLPASRRVYTNSQKPLFVLLARHTYHFPLPPSCPPAFLPSRILPSPSSIHHHTDTNSPSSVARRPTLLWRRFRLQSCPPLPPLPLASSQPFFAVRTNYAGSSPPPPATYAPYCRHVWNDMRSCAPARSLLVGCSGHRVSRVSED
ncbi:hypothetical protein C8Q76DRAFT_261131 [Earliella scabrosa]|nr:hypothetical protein C8Q76DRAFT_261131 [Earliella scabrosa]